MGKWWLSQIGKTQIRNVLAILIVLGCFALLYILQVREIPKSNKDIVNIAVGFVFGGALAGVVGYYFGNTKSNAEHDSSSK